MNIHLRMKEQTDLAAIYAEDGAFHTAAKILKQLAAEVKKHAAASDKMMKELKL